MRSDRKHICSLSVPVFYCCITNYPKLSGLKPHPFTTLQFYGSEVWGVPSQDKNQSVSQAGISSAGPREEISSKLKQVVGRIPFFMVPEVPSPQWTSAQGVCVLLGTTHISPHCGLFSSDFKTATTFQVLALGTVLFCF